MNTKSAGRIHGNPLIGMCERACIEVKKIFDGCLTRMSDAPFTLRAEGFTAGTVPPYAFVSAVSSGASRVNDLAVSPGSGTRSRLTFTVTTPVTLSYIDAAGAAGSASGSVILNRDLELTLPTDSVFPYSVEAATSLSGRMGAFGTDNTTVSFNACVIQIVRVAATVELLVPTYGYCEYPVCTDTEGRCPGVFSLPLFPSGE